MRGWKKYLSLLFIGGGSFAFSQQFLPNYIDTNLSDARLELAGNAFLHSTSLTNEFSGKFLRGGEISNEVIDKVYDIQDDYNRVGGGYSGRLEFRAGKPVFKNSERWSWMIDYSMEAHFSGQYSKDFIGLPFKGNKEYLGGKADLSDAVGSMVQYMTIGGGFHDRKTKSFVSLNLVLPQNYLELDADRAIFHFKEDGESIFANVDASYIQSNSYTYFKGLGVSINFDYNIAFGKEDSFNGFVSLVGRNIGFYALNKAEVNRIQVKESFSGFSIGDLIEGGQFESLLDTLQGDQSFENKYRLLPGYFQVGKTVKANAEKQLQTFFGARMYLNRLYRPMLYFGIDYQTKEKLGVGAQVSYGGYGDFRLGVYLGYTGESFSAAIGSEDLLGLLMKNQFGYSGLIRLGWRF